MIELSQRLGVHTVAEGIRGAESVVLEGASHMAHVERTKDYLRLLARFLSRVEQG